MKRVSYNASLWGKDYGVRRCPSGEFNSGFQFEAIVAEVLKGEKASGQESGKDVIINNKRFECKCPLKNPANWGCVNVGKCDKAEDAAKAYINECASDASFGGFIVAISEKELVILSAAEMLIVIAGRLAAKRKTGTNLRTWKLRKITEKDLMKI